MANRTIEKDFDLHWAQDVFDDKLVSGIKVGGVLYGHPGNPLPIKFTQPTLKVATSTKFKFKLCSIVPKTEILATQKYSLCLLLKQKKSLR